MVDFSRVAFVWGTAQGGTPAGPPSVSVSLWPHVLGCPLLRWGEWGCPYDLSAYDLFLVNLFATGDATHIEQIRAANPSAVIVAMPDPSLDIVLARPEWIFLLKQMQQADVIGGRTVHDYEVYRALLNKPAVVLPSPIGPTDFYLPYRSAPKDDYIVTQDHPLTPAAEAHNVAALALIQQRTGLPVIYASAHNHTREYAEMAGLKAEWRGHINFFEFVALTARARLCVDVYARHSYHRQAVLCAMVGTPCVGSTWTSVTGHPKVDPFNPGAAEREALALLNDAAHYARVRHSGFQVVEAYYGFEASRERVAELMDKFVKPRAIAEVSR